jgi:hypothetical protein
LIEVVNTLSEPVDTSPTVIARSNAESRYVSLSSDQRVSTWELASRERSSELADR